ncbi:peptidyl-prolyl cis-trans isomerase FKBP43 isoform X2 [Spinacia oleracea]|uniref:peptidylprolyl isomerase n=1 Tax=Spinacia oleracea TaxID=3562 RepID=A0A9R0JRR8_SPIOL|nr:peptidyl-prolyl cis-trans isomerase FKBP43-like isoform X2 [Spinacia oleracea]
MLISENSDNDNDAGNFPTQTQTQTRIKGPLPKSKPSSPSPSPSPYSAPKPFWGVVVTPEHPVTVTFRNHRRLRLSKAILGKPCLDKFTEARSVLSIKYGDNPESYLCSLRIDNCEMTELDFDLEHPHSIVFTVEGPRGIHLVGCFYGESSATNVDAPPLINNGGVGGRIEESVSRIILENEFQGKGTSDVVGEPVREEGNSEMLQDLTEALKKLPILSVTSIVRKYMTATNQGDETIVQEDKQRGTNSAQRKLDLEVQEPNGQVDGNEKESEGKRKRKRKNKCLVELPNTNRVDALDGDNDEGEEKTKRKRKNKHKEELPSADRVGEDNDDGSLKLDSPLTHSGEVQKQKNQISEYHDDMIDIRSENHGSPQNRVLDSKEAKKLKKEKKKQKQTSDDDDQNRSENHGFLQNPALDSKEAKKLKREKKKQKKQTSDDDDQNRAASGFERVEKRKKRRAKVDEDELVRSALHGQPEDPALNDQQEDSALDARQAKKSKKQSKKGVKVGEVRSPTRTSARISRKQDVDPVEIQDNVEPIKIQDNVEPMKIQDNVEPVQIQDNVEPVKMQENVPGTNQLVVCGLPAIAKR